MQAAAGTEVLTTGQTADQAGDGSCCSTFYELDWVRELAGDIFHPGGMALTRRTLASMHLPAGALLADLGCGTGSTVILAARDLDLHVSGIDLSASNLRRAKERTAELSRVPGSIHFLRADAVNLPFVDHVLDGVIAECTLSLFPNKPAVMAEIARVLRPGGTLAVTDMARGGDLPEDVAAVLAPWTCMMDTLDHDGFVQLFETAGFEVEQFEDASEGLDQLVSALKRKLLLVGAGALLGTAGVPDLDLGAIRYWLDRFRREVRAGTIRYLQFALRSTANSRR